MFSKKVFAKAQCLKFKWKTISKLEEKKNFCVLIEDIKNSPSTFYCHTCVLNILRTVLFFLHEEDFIDDSFFSFW